MGWARLGDSQRYRSITISVQIPLKTKYTIAASTGLATPGEGREGSKNDGPHRSVGLENRARSFFSFYEGMVLNMAGAKDTFIGQVLIRYVYLLPAS